MRRLIDCGLVNAVMALPPLALDHQPRDSLGTVPEIQPIAVKLPLALSVNGDVCVGASAMDQSIILMHSNESHDEQQNQQAWQTMAPSFTHALDTLTQVSL